MWARPNQGALKKDILRRNQAGRVTRLRRLAPVVAVAHSRLSNDPTYAEVLFETFGVRVVGLHITRNGDGMNAERRPIKNGSMLIYTIGRTYLLELFHSELQSDLIRFVDSPMMRRAFEQLANLEVEQRDTGTIYKCLKGHDDLGISLAMLAWAARHPHLSYWVGSIAATRRPRKPRQTISCAGWT